MISCASVTAICEIFDGPSCNCFPDHPAHCHLRTHTAIERHTLRKTLRACICMIRAHPSRMFFLLPDGHLYCSIHAIEGRHDVEHGGPGGQRHFQINRQQRDRCVSIFIAVSTSRKSDLLVGLTILGQVVLCKCTHTILIQSSYHIT